VSSYLLLLQNQRRDNEIAVEARMKVPHPNSSTLGFYTSPKELLGLKQLLGYVVCYIG